MTILLAFLAVYRLLMRRTARTGRRAATVPVERDVATLPRRARAR